MTKGISATVVVLILGFCNKTFLHVNMPACARHECFAIGLRISLREIFRSIEEEAIILKLPGV
jgi:hypothetical protein